MPQISLYWLVAQQQPTKLRPQNCQYFYAIFSAESNGFGLLFSQEKYVAKKQLKPN